MTKNLFDLFDGFRDTNEREATVDYFRRATKRSGRSFWEANPIMGVWWIMCHPEHLKESNGELSLKEVPEGIDFFDSMSTLYELVVEFPEFIEYFPHLKVVLGAPIIKTEVR